MWWYHGISGGLLYFVTFTTKQDTFDGSSVTSLKFYTKEGIDFGEAHLFYNNNNNNNNNNIQSFNFIQEHRK